MGASDIRVAITGFGGLDNPEPGTGVARALRQGWRGDIEIHALGYDAWMTGAWLPELSDRVHRLPPLAQGEHALLERVLELHAAHPFDALIPCLDLEVRAFAMIARQLQAADIRVMLPGAEQLDAVTKSALPLFAHGHDILTPHTIHVADPDHVPMYADQLGYPVIVKGTVIDAVRATGSEEAKLEADRLARKWGGGAILQRPVTGEEYVVAMVARDDGSLLGHVALRKLALDQRGKSMIGVVVDDPDLIREAKRILGKLDWAGPLELEFIRERGSGRLYLIEVNCRYPSWIAASHWSGVNLPVAHLRELMRPGHRVRSQAAPGTAYLRAAEDFAIPMQCVRDLDRFGSVAPQRAAPVPGAAAGSGKKLTVAVTGMSSLQVVMPGLGVARSLRMGEAVGRVVGLGYGPNDTGVYRRELVDAAYALPDSRDPQLLLDRLTEVHREERLDIVMPTLDLELPRFTAIAEPLAEMGIRMVLPPPGAMERVTKTKLFVEGNRPSWGIIDLPHTIKLWTLQGLDRAAEEIGFPMQIKGPVSGAWPVHDIDAARATWLRLRGNGWQEALAQVHVEGDHVAVTGLCDDDGELVGGFAIKKAVRCRAGTTWGATRLDHSDLIDSFAAFASEIGWRGPIEAEFIRDELTDRYQLIEINPRFPAWISFAAECGVNLPELCARLAAGQDASLDGGANSRVFMRTFVDYPLTMGDFARMATQGAIVHE